MTVASEEVKQRATNPFLISEKLEAVSRQGCACLSEEDRLLLPWAGLFPYSDKPDYCMLRLKIPGGGLMSGQLKHLAQLTQEQTHKFVDLTTRQEIQLIGVPLKAAHALLDSLETVGLSSWGAGGDTVRNVVGCPVSGLSAEESWDPSGALLEAHQAFLRDPEFSNLPQELTISISACPQQCQHPEIHCVSLVGMTRKVGEAVQPGFDLRLGGALAPEPCFAQRLNTFVPSEQVIPVLKAVALLYRDAAGLRADRARARLSFLVAELGPSGFRAALEEKLGHRLEEVGPSEDPPDTCQDHVGVHEQKQKGLFCIGIPVLAGRLSAEQMAKVADLSERYGGGTLRITARQNLLLGGIPQERVAQVMEGCESVGLKVNASALLRAVVTCTETPPAPPDSTEAKARSEELVEYLQTQVLLDEPLRIHLCGCGATCAVIPIAHIGLAATTVEVEGQAIDAYDVALGGGMGAQRAFSRWVVRGIPAAELKLRLERLLVGYKKGRKAKGKETFNAFCQRVGEEALVRLLEKKKEEEQ